MNSSKIKTSNEIRHTFLEFFSDKGHKIVDSSPLVPQDDPTLLFTNAGMVQFKDIFLGRRSPNYLRATTSQKCVRAGGKHNDLENVGKTPRHHTFFEMLGNFSFGDYFKQEAILYAWELLVHVLGIPSEKLWITVYKDDDEAARLWRTEVGLSEDRILRLGEKDNFWSMGDVGPCGPCSEIIYDRGQQFGCGNDECGIGVCDCDRWLELWNLVFMQYERDQSGNMDPLEQTGVDTGLGLERIASVLQGVHSNYDTDLFTPIFAGLERLVDHEYSGSDGEKDFAFRVIADHVRACTFLIADGVFPSNEGRGYVLRRILRRAARFGLDLDHEGPLLAPLVSVVVELMGDAYPELKERESFIRQTIKREEERFGQTLQQGLELLSEMIAEVTQDNGDAISAEQAFKLYDTYGFPVDLCEDVAQKHGLSVERAGFEQLMKEQRERARKAQKAEDGALEVDDVGSQIDDLEETEFVGYQQTEISTQVVGILNADDNRIDCASEGEEVTIFLRKTPFYAESGGQMSDTGHITADSAVVSITEVVELGDRHQLHCGQVEQGKIKEGDDVVASIDDDRRNAVARNHTATHLLHAVLREILGEHVQQSGSLVDSDRLRFDFTHHSPLTVEQTTEIENRINSIILDGRDVWAELKNYARAREDGAVALFGQRYSSEQVRVIDIEGASKELCGGTHVQSTSQLGSFKITGEESVGSGMRRVEAVTGEETISWIQQYEQKVQRLAETLDTSIDELPDRVSELQDNLNAARRKNQKVYSNLLQMQVELIESDAEYIDDIALLAERVEAEQPEHLRQMADSLRHRLGELALVLVCTTEDESVVVVGAATKNAVDQGVHMGNVVSELGQQLGGGGGGRPDMAQAGGNRPDKIPSVLKAGRKILEKRLQPV